MRELDYYSNFLKLNLLAVLVRWIILAELCSDIQRNRSVMGSCGSMSSQNLVVHPSSDFEGVQIVCKTWIKTYSNLFDYNAKPDQINLRMLNVLKQTRITKIFGQYILTPYPERDKDQDLIKKSEATIDILVSAEKKKAPEDQEKSYSIVSQCQKTKQQPWIAVRSLPSRRYVIKEGDMLRIGKQRVRVKEIIEKEEEVKEEDEEITAKGLLYENLTKQGKAQQIIQSEIGNYVCRFCLDTAEPGHPLMAPCNCAGSSKYVHLRCVQTWLTKTINPRNIGKATAITWKPLICELCGKTLPFKVYLDGKRYFTVNIPKPKRPYIVLNPIFRQKESNKSKHYLLVSFAEQREMIAGRKADSDIVISDDSTVSRHHSKFSFQRKNGEGRFFIQDLESKFATLVLLRKEFQMRHQLNGISIQLGGDVLELRVGARSASQGQSDLEDLINKSQEDNSDDNELVEEQQGPQQNEVQPSPAPQ